MQSKTMTPLSFAADRVPEDQLDKFLDRVNRVWRYAIEQGAELRPYSRHLELNALEIQFLMSKYPTDSAIPSESREVNQAAAQKDKKPIMTETSKEMKTEKPSKAIQEQPAKTWETPSVLDLINYAEMVAATCGLVIMFSWVGLVFSLITNAFYFDAMRTVKKASSWGSAQFALFICFGLSAVYAFVHFNTAMKMIADDTQYDKVTVAITAAIILSGISWASMRQSYLKKNEEVENG